MFRHFDVLNRSLSERFISQIRIACVTDNDSIKALIVDHEDDVYAIGKDYNEISEPLKLDSICKSGVIDFSFGRGHVVALTDEGNVFTWGQNDHHQCGNGGEEYLKVPVQITFNQMNLNEKVTSIKCGWDHTLALTDSGSLYSWGRNYYGQCGTGTRDNVKVPEKLNIDKVKLIACGAGHSMALLANGQVYGWGENGDGQLGLGRETHCERNPCYVAEFKEINKLSCGMYHTLALSTSRQLYTCGFNDYGQLGIGNKERRHSPQLIQTHSPFIDIAALWCTNISVAFKENKKCYAWGRTKMGNWDTPTESSCDSFNDAFALYNKSAQVTYQCIVVETNGLRSPRNKSVHCNVGKINFNTKNIIGRGPTGTCVYKGTFEGKQPVAVKRFDYFDMADNEIKSLVSLHHQNLVRIYAIECDDKFIFRYIAFELMDMTIKECVERKRNGELIEPNDTTILIQISEGLAYLHSQKIIHCNIRPENVFISSPMRPNGNRKAMITDFCLFNQMKLTPLSLRVDDGWIAGEILKSENNTLKPTIASDVFALGCLFYYVLTGGNHPFGDQFHRQANICDDRYNIEALKNDESFCKYNLIEAMINADPFKRPPMDAVLKHPMFWDSKITLSFIGKVSNSLDQERNVRDSPLNKGLEKRTRAVTKGDWMQIISQQLQQDLQNSSYDGSSVRDLLQMIRNKHQHYEELLDDVKHSLGTLPENFVSYFTTRFPLLIIHTYIIFQLCKTEVAFKEFYCRDSFTFDFEKV